MFLVGYTLWSCSTCSAGDLDNAACPTRFSKLHKVVAWKGSSTSFPEKFGRLPTRSLLRVGDSGQSLY